MKKLFTLKFLFLVFVAGLLSTPSWGQIAWNFTAGNATPSSTVANVTTSDLVQGNNNGTTSFINATSASSGYTGASGTNNAGLAARTGVLNIAASGSAYIEFTLTPAANYTVTLTAISFGTRSTGTGPQAYTLRSSLDAYGSDLTTGTIANNSAWSLKSNSGLSVSNVGATPVTFRIYGYNGAGTVSAGTANWRLDDISLTVTVASTISSNANLSSLTLSAGTLTPSFASGTTSYTASVANTVSSITVTPTSADVNSVIRVNGTIVTSGSASSPISLNVGLNSITVLVTAQDGTTTKTYTIDVTRAAAGTPTFSTTSVLAGFGNVCINTTAGPNSFTLDGNNLDGSNSSTITINSLAGFNYSLNSGGPYTSTLSFTYSGNSFTGQIIYVQFNPTAVQSYNGDITITGGGITNYPVAATGAGVNTTPTVTTGTNTPSGSTATLNGTINPIGCSPVTAYGFEYSINSGFADGTGTPIASTNLSGNNFSAVLSGLVANKRYYYKAFATTSGGTVYGTQQAFNAPPIPVVLSAQPSLTYTETFADIANWGNFFVGGIGSEHFSQASGSTGTIPNATNVTTTTVFSTGSSGGVQRGTDQVSPLTPTQSIVLLSTGGTDNSSSAAFDFYMDFTGVNAGTLSFDYQTLSNSLAGSVNNRAGSLRVYATTDGITYTEVTNILNFINDAPISGSKTNISLPASFNNSPTARLRFYYYNGTGGTTGSRPKISIDNITVTAVATTPCTTPTAAATALTFGTVNDVSIAGSFTASSPASDQYLVIASTNNNLTSNPVNGQIYNIGDNVGDGTVVAKGSGTSFTATGLSPSTQYYFFVFSANAVCTGGPLYNTGSILTGQATTAAGLPPCAAPTDQPGNLIFGTTTTNSIQGAFTANTANEYLVVRSTSATLSTDPVNGHAYSVGEVLGNGIVVQRNNSTSFTATNLTPNTTYYFFVFSGNSQACINGPAFNSSSPLTGSTATIPLPACVAPSAQPYNLVLRSSNTAISGTYASGVGADDYLVIRSTTATLSGTPSDNTDYIVGDNLGGGIVVANSSNNTFLNTGVMPGVIYYFFVFAANKNCSGGTKYLTTSPLTASTTTSNAVTSNYYFGTLHSHSSYSDGNKDNLSYTPADDYAYAKTALCMDYLGISEHNHYSSFRNPGDSIIRYHQALIQATNFTAANPGFLALYGMEWGVISGGGHVVVYGDGMDNLLGWESGSGVWGPTNNYDVYVAKSDYTGPNGLFKTVNDYVAQNTFATLAHPNLTDYNNLANVTYNPVADSAITGAAVESGYATSTNTTYSDPASSMSYLWYYQTMLSKGYHLGPVIDHDNHNTTFGHTAYTRTAIVAPALTKTDIISAMRNMHFYATQDCDSKVDFSVNTFSMGSVVTDRYAPAISVTLTDASTTTSNAIIRLMYGQPGSGVLPAQIDSVIGNTYTHIDNSLANLATGYYYIDVTNGTSRIVSAPIWYTRNDNNGNVLPVKLTSFTAMKERSTVKLEWTTSQEINSKEFIVERSTDGAVYQKIGVVTARGNSSTASTYTLTDAQPVAGNNYYRLRTVDIDDKFELSKVVKINFSKAYTVSLSPNPATDKVIITLSNREPLQMQIIDMTGKVVTSMMLYDVVNSVSVDNLAKGLYLIKLNGQNGIYTEKLVKE